MSKACCKGCSFNMTLALELGLVRAINCTKINVDEGALMTRKAIDHSQGENTPM